MKRNEKKISGQWEAVSDFIRRGFVSFSAKNIYNNQGQTSDESKISRKLITSFDNNLRRRPISG